MDQIVSHLSLIMPFWKLLASDKCLSQKLLDEHYCRQVILINSYTDQMLSDKKLSLALFEKGDGEQLLLSLV